MAKESEKAKASAALLELKTPKKAREGVAGLVRRFAEHRKELKQKQNETEIRVSYINPFFEALGWDVRNTRGYAESYKDVVHEAAVRVEGKMKAPDYSFRIGGQRKFFLEAKAPSVDIEHDVSPAFQLRRYAWSAKLPVSLLMDFEELAVYQVSRRPMKKDKASVDRVALYRFEEFSEKLDEIYSIFSKEAVRKGSFDRYVAGVRKKRGTAHVDDEFLREMEAWRVELAKNLALRNPGLGVEEMNFAVQAILDRILFLRIAEDRGIEDYGRLQNIAHGEKVYKQLVSYFHDSDDRYNAGLFDFRKDTLTLKLKVDDKVLKHIILELYDPSPYVFDVIEADIFGSVYERFLGSVIRLTAGHRAKVEEKPEVRKAGGVYYTPTYIVNYIVEHTVGELLKGKTSKEVEKLRILDPACGSGSFLIAAYQRLLNWHLEWYSEHNPKKHAREKNPKIAEVGDGQWKLTIAERKRILLKNIFGVDIDPQAVEVTKLNLLLKVLEGGSRETIDADLKLFRERALPNIDENIKCGNSLIGTDFQADLFGDKDVNAFDWEAEFPKIFREKNRGFDCVIGNPPYSNYSSRGSMRAFYIREKLLVESKILEQTIQYCARKYPYVSQGCVDLYKWFVAKGFALLNDRGTFGFVIPDTWYVQAKYADLKNLIVRQAGSVYFHDLGMGVFTQATVPTCVLILNRDRKSEFYMENLKNETNKAKSLGQRVIAVRDTAEQSRSFPLVRKFHHDYGVDSRLLDFLTLREAQHIPVAKLHQGHTKINFPIIDSKNMDRYYFSWTPKKSYPKSGVYKTTNGERLIIRKTGDRIVASITPQTESYVLQSLYQSIAYEHNYNLKYFLGIVNSRFITWLYQHSEFGQKGRTFAQFRKGNLDKLPVRTIDFSNSKEKKMHDEMVALVKRMLEIKKREAESKTPHAKKTLSRQIAATDAAIDKLVYKLYGLTEEEIKVVEETNV